MLFFFFLFFWGGELGWGGDGGILSTQRPLPPALSSPVCSSSTHTSDPPDGHAWLPPDITAEAPIAGTGAAPGARDRERAGRAGGGGGEDVDGDGGGSGGGSVSMQGMGTLRLGSRAVMYTAETLPKGKNRVMGVSRE